MPTVLVSRQIVHSLAIGAAASAAMAGDSPRSLRVHSVFDSTLNIEIEGEDILVAVTGPAGDGFAHAVATEYEGSFRKWNLEPGDRGSLSENLIVFHTRGGRTAIDLSRARVSRRSVLPAWTCTGDGSAFRACENGLEMVQAERGCDLRLSLLRSGGQAATPMAEELCRAARGLGRAALDFVSARGVRRTAARETAAVRQAATSLVGRGPGLTPAGDDFLSGFLAALRCASVQDGAGRAIRELDAELCSAIERSLSSTVAVSASLLRCAMRSYWLRPLAGIADALASGSAAGASRALADLCAFGHSSGADIATGFLYGLGLFARPEDR